MKSPFETYATGIAFPEGPVVDTQGRLFVCARRNGQIFVITPQRTVDPYITTGGKPNGLAIDASQNLYVADAVAKCILIVSPQRETQTRLPNQSDSTRFVGPNDLCFGPDGDLYFTDPGLSFEKRDGSIFRLNLTTGVLTKLASELQFPNGLAVSSDDGSLYFVDSTTSSLFLLDLSTRPPCTPRRIHSFGEKTTPDGMAWLDADHLLVALHGAGELTRVHVGNKTEQRWSTGAGTHPTNVIVHGETCYVTDDTQSAVLRCDVNILDS